MKRLLRNAAIMPALLLLAVSALAGGGSSKPSGMNTSLLISSVTGLEKMISENSDVRESEIFAGSSEEKRPGSKICVCQILDMKSSNYNHSNMVLLAEKTNHGDISADAGQAKVALELEKKHLKTFFYNKIKVNQMIMDGTDCHTMFKRLSAENGELVLYEILNADIQR